MLTDLDGSYELLCIRLEFPLAFVNIVWASRDNAPGTNRCLCDVSTYPESVRLILDIRE